MELSLTEAADSGPIAEQLSHQGPALEDVAVQQRQQPIQNEEEQNRQAALAAAAVPEEDEFEPHNLIYSLFRLGFLFALLAQNGSAMRVAVLSVLAFLIVLNQLGIYRWETVMEWIHRQPQRQEPVAAQGPQENEALLQGQQQQSQQEDPKEGFWTTVSDICLSFLSSAFPAPPQQPQHNAAPPAVAAQR